MSAIVKAGERVNRHAMIARATPRISMAQLTAKARTILGRDRGILFFFIFLVY